MCVPEYPQVTPLPKISEYFLLTRSWRMTGKTVKPTFLTRHWALMEGRDVLFNTIKTRHIEMNE